MFGMNQEQMMGLVRQGLIIFGTLAASLGWLSPEKVATITATVMAVAGPLTVLAGIIWGLVNKTHANMIALGASQVDANGSPLVDRVVLNSSAQGAKELSKSTPSNVVLSN